MNHDPVLRDVVLVGGGHAHALLMRQWAMKPMAGVRLTLISSTVLTPYSGMLPGLIAGHYDHADVHIDLARVCQWAGVRFIASTMTALDLDARQIILADRPPIDFDVVSLDTGSTPDLSVAGAPQHSVPVKPVSSFHARWQDVRARVDAMDETAGAAPLELGVVGSGAGGFELVAAVRHSLPAGRARCHWFLRGDTAINDRPARVGQLAVEAAEYAGVVVHRGFDVIAVESDAVCSADGRRQVLDEVIWCTAAAAPEWIARAGLATDARGFVATNACLQSESHPFVFAAGDVGTQRETPSAKAGVFAVRQAPVLTENIRRFLAAQPLKTYRPQRGFLSLMATGPKHAIGNRGPLTVSGTWVWRWKNHIDLVFMRQFHELKAMQDNTPRFAVPEAMLQGSSLDRAALAPDAMRCRACGAKVGDRLLDEVLSSLMVIEREGIITGLESLADTAVFSTGGHALVQSVDQLSMPIDDPYLFGRLAALHALSDTCTRRSRAHSAQVLLTLPFAEDRIVRRELRQLMAGVLDALNSEGCALIGGHSAEGAEVSLGFVINALLEPGAGSAPCEGDALILTKPIGSGVLLAAHQQFRVRGESLHRALSVMQQSNAPAAEILHGEEVSLITDITGFGLLGHIHRLLRTTDCRAALHLDAIPMLPDALAMAEAGIESSLFRHNRGILDAWPGAAALPLAWQRLFCDPQTGGGLFAVVPAHRRVAILDALRAAGYPSAACIGELRIGAQHELLVRESAPAHFPGEQSDA